MGRLAAWTVFLLALFVAGMVALDLYLKGH